VGAKENAPGPALVSIKEGIDLVKKNGGNLVREPEEEDGFVHLAFCFDTEGNEFMLTQKRPS
jgi:predicted enzyme related to lactoylglutathione lyase